MAQDQRHAFEMKLTVPGMTIVLGCMARVTLAAGTNLCMPKESALFSCSIENSNRIASMCEAPSSTNQRGALYYRFGSASDHIELTYPTTPVDPGKAFKYLWTGYSKGGTSALSFHIGKWRYSVFSTRSAYVAQAGVIVRKDQRIKKYTCGTVTTETSTFFLDRLGLPSAQDDVDYVGTEALMTGALLYRFLRWAEETFEGGVERAT
jgi:hypothetical protein